MEDTKKTLSLKIPLKAVPETLKALRAAERAEVQAQKKAVKKQEIKSNRGIVKKLSKRFPRCFNYDAPKPLKIGIHQDILGVVGESFGSSPDLLCAIKYYANSIAYHEAVLNGEHRYDLHGKAVTPLTDDDKRYASETLERLKQKLQKAAETNPKPKRMPFRPRTSHGGTSRPFKRGEYSR